MQQTTTKLKKLTLSPLVCFFFFFFVCGVFLGHQIALPRHKPLDRLDFFVSSATWWLPANTALERHRHRVYFKTSYYSSLFFNNNNQTR